MPRTADHRLCRQAALWRSKVSANCGQSPVAETCASPLDTDRDREAPSAQSIQKNAAIVRASNIKAWVADTAAAWGHWPRPDSELSCDPGMVLLLGSGSHVCNSTRKLPV
jgi:hypothetical protein